MSKNIQPIAGYVLAKDVDLTSSSLVFAGKPEEKNIAEVVAIGEPKEDFENKSKTTVNLQSGAIIIYKKYAYTEVELEGETFRLIDFDDIVGVINE